LKEDKASWTEKQVIDYLYEYLIDKARQLQGAAQAKDIIIGAAFRKAMPSFFSLPNSEYGPVT